jgi:CDP-4-dehydro-6-deoxyglucose reductase
VRRAGVELTAGRRRRKMQNLVCKTGYAPQAPAVVEIAWDRGNAMSAQRGPLIGTVRQAVDAIAPRKQRSSPERYVATAHDQESSHGRSVMEFGQLPTHTPGAESKRTTMTCRVTIKPSDHVFDVEPDETLLQAALRQGFPLPYGCRDGACGSCKGKILAGTVDYGRYQSTALSEADRDAGFALFCQARPLSDLLIESREVGAVRDIPIKTLPCRVQRLERLAPDVMALYLRLPANERLQFLAGQYIEILTREGKRRAFSMANAPHDDEFLQLHLRHYAGGNFTEYVFTRMKEREILRFEGPFGTFFLREDSDKPIIFLASGTGFAPIKGMLEHAFHRGIDRPMVLYWGARTRPDLYLDALPRQWAQTHPNFRYVPVLSEARPEDEWTGRTGFVHRAVMEDQTDLSGYHVYSCGAPVMVEAAHRDFTTQCALPEEAFFSDAFTSASDGLKNTTAG